ncbi:MAG: hydrogenase maturation protease [Acidobacteria bacterium]|nr:hydrogenase maturation protease [Acidobacteriota bacterium]
MEGWSDAEEVILVDAVVTGVPPGAITVWDARTAPLAGDFIRCSTHAFGVAEAVELARLLDRLPPRLRIYGIEGTNFEPGAEPSPAVREAAERLAEQIAREAPACLAGPAAAACSTS